MVTLKYDCRAGSEANGVSNHFVTHSTVAHVCDHEVEMEWDAEGTGYESATPSSRERFPETGTMSGRHM